MYFKNSDGYFFYTFVSMIEKISSTIKQIANNFQIRISNDSNWFGISFIGF